MFINWIFAFAGRRQYASILFSWMISILWIYGTQKYTDHAELAEPVILGISTAPALTRYLQSYAPKYPMGFSVVMAPCSDDDSGKTLFDHQWLAMFTPVLILLTLIILLPASLCLIPSYILYESDSNIVLWFKIKYCPCKIINL